MTFFQKILLVIGFLTFCMSIGGLLGYLDGRLSCRPTAGKGREKALR